MGGILAGVSGQNPPEVIERKTRTVPTRGKYLDRSGVTTRCNADSHANLVIGRRVVLEYTERFNRVDADP